MTKRRLENTRVHFGANSPVSVNSHSKSIVLNVVFIAPEPLKLNLFS